MSIDIATGEKKDCGKVVDGRLGASFWFFVDKDSNLWFTLWKRNYSYENDFGNLYCYNPEADSIKTYDNVLPMGQLIDGTPVSEARNEQRAWTWLSPFPGRDKCYFIQGTLGGGDERLWIFDPSKDIVSGEAFEPVAYIGSSYFETAVGGDRLYFCTHLSNYWKEGIEAYPGAHVFGYEMATGTFRDFGIVKERYSIYSAIAVDPVLKKLYVFSVPFVPELYKSDGCHLMSIDIATGEKKDCGKVVDGRLGASFWFFVDKDSNVWFTLWKRNYSYENDFGNLYCYNPEADSITTFDNVLPKGELIDGTPVSETRNEQRAWTWLSPFPGRDKCYFIQGTLGGGDERLWIFDPSKDIVSGEAFEPVAYIGSSYFETAVGGDRLYFCQYEDLEDARTIFSEDEREIDPASPEYVERKIHLRSISLAEGGLNREIKDHGPLVDQDGHAALMIMSMAADNDGHVFVYGSWRPNSFKEATLQYLLFEYPNGDLYRLLKRGEFFAVINTNED